MITLNLTTEPGIISELPCLRWGGGIINWVCAQCNKVKLKYLWAGACIFKEHCRLHCHDGECGNPHLYRVHVDYTRLVHIPPCSITVDMPLVRGRCRLIALFVFGNPESDSLRGRLQMVDRMLHLCGQVSGHLHGAARQNRGRPATAREVEAIGVRRGEVFGEHGHFVVFVLILTSHINICLK